jgi:hypothetical protein
MAAYQPVVQACGSQCASVGTIKSVLVLLMHGADVKNFIFNFCDCNQQVHTTVIRITTIFLKTHVSDHSGPSSGSTLIVVV